MKRRPGVRNALGRRWFWCHLQRHLPRAAGRHRRRVRAWNRVFDSIRENTLKVVSVDARVKTTRHEGDHLLEEERGEADYSAP